MSHQVVAFLLRSLPPNMRTDKSNARLRLFPPYPTPFDSTTLPMPPSSCSPKQLPTSTGPSSSSTVQRATSQDLFSLTPPAPSIPKPSPISSRAANCNCRSARAPEHSAAATPRGGRRIYVLLRMDACEHACTRSICFMSSAMQRGGRLCVVAELCELAQPTPAAFTAHDPLTGAMERPDVLPNYQPHKRQSVCSKRVARERFTWFATHIY